MPNADALELNLVYPGDPYWKADTRAGGQLEINDDNPRGNTSASLEGNASLALYVTTPDDPKTKGVNESFDDWAFYVRNSKTAMNADWTYYDSAGYSISTDYSWGLLSEINEISFDWFRETAINESYKNYDPWNLQTPVLRLLIGDKTGNGITFSELVWEMYYTPGDYITSDYKIDMPIGSWVSQDLEGQNFWRHNFYGDTYSYLNGTTIVDEDFSVAPYGTTLSAWNNNYGYDAYVFGLSVGVGSVWPGEYTGYVDNILLSFNNGKGIYDNFELGSPAPVPEPVTLLLFGSGMGIMAAGRRWRKKKDTV